MKIIITSFLNFFVLIYAGNIYAWSNVAASKNHSYCFSKANELVADGYLAKIEPWSGDGCAVYRESPDAPGVIDTINSGTVVYGHTYTDEQCESSFGGSQTFQTTADQAEAGFTTAGGACGVAAVSSSIACWDSQDGNSYCNADWASVSSGDPATADTDASSGTVSDFTPPDYMTPTEDCTGYNCVTIDGQTYEVDQDAIDNGSVTIVGGGDGSGDDGGDSGSGIDYGDGSGTPTPGTSTGDDGDPLGMGQGDGDSTLGDIVGSINGLKTSIQNGFDGLVDSLSDNFNDSLDEFGDDLTDTDGMPTEEDAINTFDGEGSVDDVMDNLNSQYDETNSGLVEEYEGVFEGGILGDAIAGMESFATSFLPDLPSGGCSPVQFNAGPASFTIDCEVFNLIKASLSWILFFFTAYEITSIALSYRSS
ncbi:MAG: hypothetical protein ACQEXI_06170 [Pseudomonadota bacterium]